MGLFKVNIIVDNTPVTRALMEAELKSLGLSEKDPEHIKIAAKSLFKKIAGGEDELFEMPKRN